MLHARALSIACFMLSYCVLLAAVDSSETASSSDCVLKGAAKHGIGEIGLYIHCMDRGRAFRRSAIRTASLMGICFSLLTSARLSYACTSEMFSDELVPLACLSRIRERFCL